MYTCMYVYVYMYVCMYVCYLSFHGIFMSVELSRNNVLCINGRIDQIK